MPRQRLVYPAAIYGLPYGLHLQVQALLLLQAPDDLESSTALQYSSQVLAYVSLPRFENGAAYPTDVLRTAREAASALWSTRQQEAAK